MNWRVGGAAVIDPDEKVWFDGASGDAVGTDEVTLTEICAETHESARTVRYYIREGLLGGSTGSGSLARYPRSNIAKIKMIRRLQDRGLHLQQMREALAKLGEGDVVSMAEAAEEVPRVEEAVKPMSSAFEYTKNLLGGLLGGRGQTPPPLAPMVIHPPVAPMPRSVPPVATVPAEVRETKLGQPRSQWERIQLHADLELHVRRPLSPHVNRRLDDLLKMARQLFTEEK